MFITLNHPEEGPVLVNPEHICALVGTDDAYRDQGAHTAIIMVNGKTAYVRETAQEISALVSQMHHQQAQTFFDSSAQSMACAVQHVQQANQAPTRMMA